MVHEVVGRQIDDVAARLSGARGPGDGVEQMRFAQPHGRVDVDRIEADRIVGRRVRNLPGDAERDLVGRAGDEAVEGHLGIEGTTGERIATWRRRFVPRLGRRWRRIALGLDDDVVLRRQPRPRLAIDPHGEMQPRHDAGFGAEGVEDLFASSWTESTSPESGWAPTDARGRQRPLRVRAGRTRNCRHPRRGRP